MPVLPVLEGETRRKEVPVLPVLWEKQGITRRVLLPVNVEV